MTKHIFNANRTFLFALVGLVILFANSRAEAKCDPGDLTIQRFSSSQQLNSPSDPSVQFSVRRRNPSVFCKYWIGFTQGQAPTYDRKLTRASASLDYDIYKTQTSAPLNLKSYPTAATMGEVYVNEFIKGGNHDNEHVFTHHPKMTTPLPGPFQTATVGLYSDTVQIKIFDGDFPPNGVPVELASVPQTYTYDIPAFTALSLLDSGVPYTDPPVTLKTLNFGTLSTGQQMSFDLVLLFNSGYRVTFTSTHGSKMKHATATTVVPYTLEIEGVAKPLPAGSPVEVSTGSGQSPSAPLGHRLPVRVTIGNVSQSFAGVYSDSITIVMTAN